MNKLLFILALVVSSPVFAADLECSYTMTRSTYAHIKVYYLHEEPEGLRYVYTSSPELLQVRTHYIHAQGHPVAAEWYVEGRLVKTCGEIPPDDMIFSDGFESGDLGRWSRWTLLRN